MNTATPQQHAAARELTFATNATQQQIADQVGVTRKTVSSWSRMGRWQEMKANSLRIPAELVDDMYRELEELNNIIHSRPPGQRIPTDKEAALRHRILMSIKQIKKQQSVPEMQQTINLFIRYIEETDTYAAKIMKNNLTNFLEHTDPSGFRPCDIEYASSKEVTDPIPTEADPFRDPTETTPDLNASDFNVSSPKLLEEHIEKLNDKKHEVASLEYKKKVLKERISMSQQLTEHNERGEEVTLYCIDGTTADILSSSSIKYFQALINDYDDRLTQLRLEDLAARQEHEKLLEEFYTLYPHLRPDSDQAA
ncbi:MAG: hypothetical protein WCG87_08455 [Bacteroidota bacterium]